MNFKTVLKSVYLNEDLVGAIFLQKNSSLLSKAVSYFGESNYSHVGIIFGSFVEEGKFTHITMESSLMGGQLGNFDKYLKDDYVIYKPIDIEQEKIYKAIRWCTRNLVEKQPYGYPEIAGLLFKYYLSKIGINIKNPIRYGLICSELVAYYLYMLGLYKKEDIESCIPKDIESFLKITPNFKIFSVV